jgi:hypothetical protein
MIWQTKKGKRVTVVTASEEEEAAEVPTVEVPPLHREHELELVWEIPLQAPNCSARIRKH